MTINDLHSHHSLTRHCDTKLRSEWFMFTILFRSKGYTQNTVQSSGGLCSVGFSAKYLRSEIGMVCCYICILCIKLCLWHKSATHFQTCVAKLIKCVAFCSAIHTNSNTGPMLKKTHTQHEPCPIWDYDVHSSLHGMCHGVTKFRILHHVSLSHILTRYKRILNAIILFPSKDITSPSILSPKNVVQDKILPTLRGLSPEDPSELTAILNSRYANWKKFLWLTEHHME